MDGPIQGDNDFENPTPRRTSPFVETAMTISFAAAIVSFLAITTNSSLAFANCVSDELRNIQTGLMTAEQALERADYRQANDLAKAALAKIGDRYFEPGVIDDSGQRLLLADWQERQGDWKHAANIRVRIAHSRADALARRSGC